MNQGSLITLFQATFWVISRSPLGWGQSLQEGARRRGKGERRQVWAQKEEADNPYQAPREIRLAVAGAEEPDIPSHV